MDTSANPVGDALQESQKQDPDLTIKVEGKEIHVHRSIVSEKSDYFKAMMSYDTLEKQSGTVEMKELEYEPVKACIDSMYGKEIAISLENVEQVLHVATIMQVAQLCMKISSFLQRSVDTKSIFEIRRIAKQYFLKNLIEFCDNFVLDNLTLLAKQQEFNEFEIELMASVIVMKKSVHPKRDDSKLSIILNWVNADAENRHRHLHVLMSLVDLSKISKPYLKYVLENEKIITESEEGMKLLNSAGINQSLFIKNTSIKAKPAEISFEPEANAILMAGPSSESLEAYFPTKNSCEKFCPMPPNMNVPHDIVATKDYVYLYILFEHAKMYRIDMTEDNPNWVQMKNMLLDQGWALRAALDDDFIYIVGNYRAERYNITKDEWSVIPGHTHYMNGSAVVLCGGFLYSIGEFGTHGEGSKDVQRLCTQTLEWTVVNPTKIARFSPRAVADGENIYVAGGTSEEVSSGKIECYSHRTGSWSILTRMKKVRGWNLGLCFFERKLFFLGVGCTECYDPEKKRWTEQPRARSIKLSGRFNIPVFAAVCQNDVNEGATASQTKKSRFTMALGARKGK